MIGGFVTVGFIFMPQYNKWMYNPIIRSIEDTYYPIGEINFPAVTICSNNKVFLVFFPKPIIRAVQWGLDSKHGHHPKDNMWKLL